MSDAFDARMSRITSCCWPIWHSGIALSPVLDYIQVVRDAKLKSEGFTSPLLCYEDIRCLAVAVHDARCGEGNPVLSSPSRTWITQLATGLSLNLPNFSIKRFSKGPVLTCLPARPHNKSEAKHDRRRTEARGVERTRA